MTDPSPPGETRLGIGQRLFVGLQYLLPQHLLSGAMFRLTRLPLGPLTPVLIQGFVRLFGVDLDEAEDPRPGAYRTFNAFFTRALRPGARPLAPGASTVLSPVDGTISQLGRIGAGRIFQAKGRDFSCGELLGGDSALAASFDGGLFATLYLSPRDYHRIHLPLDAELTETIHVPGRLFSVNPTTAASVQRLFARNERVVCHFRTELGPMALVLVGAIFVGSIETVWAGRITPPRGREARRLPGQPAAGPAPRLPRGAEIGRFNMGSTVILLLPPDRFQWHESLAAGSPVRVGQALTVPAH